jgi:hypothetical protein
MNQHTHGVRQALLMNLHKDAKEGWWLRCAVTVADCLLAAEYTVTVTVTWFRVCRNTP